MRFADDYVGRLVRVTRSAEYTLTDPQQRYVLSGWLLVQANSAYVDASGENPSSARSTWSRSPRSAG